MSAEPPVSRGPEVVLRAEQLTVDVAVEPVRAIVRRRVVTEVQQLEVAVRREVLEIEYAPAAEPGQAPPSGPAPGPFVVVLSEEVPVVGLVTRPYERVTVEVRSVEEQREIRERVSHERADVSRT